MRQSDEAEIVACIPHLRRYARGLNSESESADDLVQDTLERAWSKYSMWQRRGNLRAWMFGIMHNLFIDRVRSQGRRPEHASDDVPEVPDRDRQGDHLEIRDLDSALQRLSPELREVLLLVAVEELSYQEVAATLSIPIGTVMSRLSRARERLRVDLEGGSFTPRIERVK